MRSLTPPVRVVAADDVLAQARRFIDADAAAFAADADVSCTAGCSACCHQAIPVTRSELRSIRTAIAGLDEALRSTIEARIATTAASLRAAGVTEPPHDTDREARVKRAHAYFALDVPCPLLEDGVCAVRDARPLICREYLVTSDPAECARLGSGGKIVRIRSRRDVLAGFKEVSAMTGEPEYVTLSLALAEPDPPAPTGPAFSGVAMVTKLFSHMIEPSDTA